MGRVADADWGGGRPSCYPYRHTGARGDVKRRAPTSPHWLGCSTTRGVHWMLTTTPRGVLPCHVCPATSSSWPWSVGPDQSGLPSSAPTHAALAGTDDPVGEWAHDGLDGSPQPQYVRVWESQGGKGWTRAKHPQPETSIRRGSVPKIPCFFNKKPLCLRQMPPFLWS